MGNNRSKDTVVKTNGDHDLIIVNNRETHTEFRLSRENKLNVLNVGVGNYLTSYPSISNSYKTRKKIIQMKNIFIDHRNSYIF